MTDDLNRIQRAAHNRLLGGKKAASRLRRKASQARQQHGLCCCRDEEKFYLSQEEMVADKSPAVICDVCGKPKLRVTIVIDGPISSLQRLAVEDLLGIPDLLK